MAIRSQVVGEVRRLWAASPLLLGVGLVCVPVFGLSLLGLVVDDRIITGSPAWLKPAKFAISSGLYCITLAWLLASVARPSRLLRWAAEINAVVLVLEVGIIDLQAYRGTTSHFNVATPLDARLFAIMGLAIATLLVASAVVAYQLCRTSFADRAWGWALKLGMVITVVGSTTGGFMVRPTPEQAERAQATGSMPTNGGHTVGGPDGGPGLVGTGWSREHGDLRVPHFFGLHAVQAVPLLSWLAFLGFKPRSLRTRVALVGLIAASYSALIVLLTAQALAGRPLLAWDAPTLGAFGLWATLTTAGLVALTLPDRFRTGSPSLTLGA